MSDIAIGYSGIAILLTFIALKVPIGLSLITVSFGGIWLLIGEKAAWGTLGVIPYSFSATWYLSSIPMFVLMGFICFHAGLTKGLFGAARVWLSALPGGLAVAGVLGSAGFAAVTGSSVACAAAMGKIAVPEMLRHKYNPSLATGAIAAAGTIGALIPPSILFILYGIIAQVPVGKLFLGGLVAGLITAASYIAVITIRCRFNPELAPPVEQDVSWKERFAALFEIWPVVVLILGVFGGLFAGIFTPTEAGGIGAFMSLIIAIIKRSITPKGFWDSLMETLKISGSIFIIAIGASMLTRFVTFSGVGDQIADFVNILGVSPLVLLIAIALLYMLLGMFLEPIGAMLLTLPILLPIIEGSAIDLLWFGVMVAKLLEIGMITPPIGLNVFVLKSVMGNKVQIGTIFKGVAWFIVADIIVLAMLIAWPDLVLMLPALLG